jgi:hypothetical protein
MLINSHWVGCKNSYKKFLASGQVRNSLFCSLFEFIHHGFQQLLIVVFNILTIVFVST